MRLGSGSGVESTTPTRRHTDRTPDRSTAMAPTLESPPIRIYMRAPRTGRDDPRAGGHHVRRTATGLRDDVQARGRDRGQDPGQGRRMVDHGERSAQKSLAISPTSLGASRHAGVGAEPWTIRSGLPGPAGVGRSRPGTTYDGRMSDIAGAARGLPWAAWQRPETSRTASPSACSVTRAWCATCSAPSCPPSGRRPWTSTACASFRPNSSTRRATSVSATCS